MVSISSLFMGHREGIKLRLGGRSQRALKATLRRVCLKSDVVRVSVSFQVKIKRLWMYFKVHHALFPTILPPSSKLGCVGVRMSDF